MRWPDELPGVGRAYGMPLAQMRELVDYWREEYEWRAAEARLNEWPQFTTVIDGARVHFAHVRSPEPAATPLLMTHGWPGSPVEFQRVVGPLTDPRAHGGDPADAFHLVLPSIPGFGLSGPTTETGWEFKRVARAFGVLMDRLGHRTYGVQGGDWGAAISRELGLIRPDRVIGVHLNLLPGAGPPPNPGRRNWPRCPPPNGSGRWPPGSGTGCGRESGRGTPTSRRPGRRPSRTGSTTRRSGCSPGSRRSSPSGAIPRARWTGTRC